MSLEEAAKILNLDKGTSKVPDVTKVRKGTLVALTPPAV